MLPQFKIAGEFAEAIILFLAGFVEKRIIPMIDKALEKREEKQMYGLKTNQEKATKEVLEKLVFISNKDYKQSVKIRSYINRVRRNAPKDNFVVQELLQQITKER